MRESKKVGVKNERRKHANGATRSAARKGALAARRRRPKAQRQFDRAVEQWSASPHAYTAWDGALPIGTRVECRYTEERDLTGVLGTVLGYLEGRYYVIRMSKTQRTRMRHSRQPRDLFRLGALTWAEDCVYPVLAELSPAELLASGEHLQADALAAMERSAFGRHLPESVNENTANFPLNSTVYIVPADPELRGERTPGIVVGVDDDLHRAVRVTASRHGYKRNQVVTIGVDNLITRKAR